MRELDQLPLIAPPLHEPYVSRSQSATVYSAETANPKRLKTDETVESFSADDHTILVP